MTTSTEDDFHRDAVTLRDVQPKPGPDSRYLIAELEQLAKELREMQEQAK